MCGACPTKSKTKIEIRPAVKVVTTFYQYSDNVITYYCEPCLKEMQAAQPDIYDGLPEAVEGNKPCSWCSQRARQVAYNEGRIEWEVFDLETGEIILNTRNPKDIPWRLVNDTLGTKETILP